ncbi:DnaB-like helicase N-terminal domain-containing protein [Kitasatospora cineracea]|uniref:DnaB-like helicase N-terminal domain-containing protein n=1 Tax=Kitasatospora cineracea TaxID=88074 RepID=UPI003824CE11
MGPPPGGCLRRHRRGRPRRRPRRGHRPQKPATAPAAATAAEPSDGVRADEQFLLSLLVYQDSAVEEVFGWLRPGDFADPGHGRLYRCLGALHHRGEPIDSVTAQWEVQRRGLLADGTLAEDQLAPILGAHLVAGSAEWLGEQLLRTSLGRAVTESGDEHLFRAAHPAPQEHVVRLCAVNGAEPFCEQRDVGQRPTPGNGPLAPVGLVVTHRPRSEPQRPAGGVGESGAGVFSVAVQEASRRSPSSEGEPGSAV